MRKIRLLIALFVSCVIIPGFVNAAVYHNNISINQHGLGYTGIITWKHFCPIDLDVYVNHSDHEYSSTMFYVNFGENIENSLGYSGNGSYFSSVYNHDISGNNFYFQAENSKDTTNISQLAAKLHFNRTNKTDHISLSIVGKDNVQYVGNTITGLSIGSNDGNTLGSVSGVTINYEACPCDNDETKPTWTLRSWAGSQGKQGGRMRALGILTISGYINDRSNSTWNHRFTSDDMSLANYEYYNGSDMDNQVGVNKSSINMEIIYSGNYGTQQDETLTDGAGLQVSNHEGHGTTYTWNHKIRGYDIKGETAISLEIEKPVTIKISASDNSLNMGNGSNCNKNALAMDTVTYTFNTGAGPGIGHYGSISKVNPDAQVLFQISDDWAGVDTGSVVLWLKDVTTGTNHEIIWTGGVYSGEDLEFYNCTDPDTLGGIGSLRCYVKLKKPHLDFPTNTTINVSGYVEDKLGKKGMKTWEITTRRDCKEITGCYNPLVVNLWSGVISEWVPALEKAYTGTRVVITGTSAPYPYLTGDSGNVLMCGPINSDMLLLNTEGGIKLYDSDGNVVTGYMGGNLYITGLNVSVDENRKIIINSNN